MFSPAKVSTASAALPPNFCFSTCRSAWLRLCADCDFISGGVATHGSGLTVARLEAVFVAAAAVAGAYHADDSAGAVTYADPRVTRPCRMLARGTWMDGRSLLAVLCGGVISRSCTLTSLSSLY